MLDSLQSPVKPKPSSDSLNHTHASALSGSHELGPGSDQGSAGGGGSSLFRNLPVGQGVGSYPHGSRPNKLIHPSGAQGNGAHSVGMATSEVTPVSKKTMSRGNVRTPTALAMVVTPPAEDLPASLQVPIRLH